MVVAISMVRDEADIVETTVRHIATQVDEVIVADNGSRDGTSEILARLARELPVTVLDDPERGYYQAEKMTHLATLAAERGAGWVVPFDADEIWLSRSGRPIRDELHALPESVLIVEADLYDHVATALDPSGDPVERIGWRRPTPGALPKVACRALHGLTIHQGNHSASYRHTDLPATVSNLLTIRHFPYRSVAQMASKARNGAEAYAATNLPEDAGAHWRGYGRILAEHGEDGIADVFRRFFWRADPASELRLDGEVQPPLVFDPAPCLR